jgi:acyl carrier protein
MKGSSLDHQRARELIATHLGVPITAVTDQAEFTADLGADSLDLVELTMQFEDALNVSITGEESERCRCVEDALSLLDSKKAVHC